MIELIGMHEGTGPWRWRAQRVGEPMQRLYEAPNRYRYDDAKRDFERLRAEWPGERANDRSNHGLFAR